MKKTQLLLFVMLLVAGSFSAFSQEKTGKVVFIRYTGEQGALVNDKVYIDGKLTCKLKNNRFSSHDVPVGEHQLTTRSGGLPAGKMDPLTITVVEGKTNYVELVTTTTGMGSAKLYCQEVTENSAQVLLKKVKQETDCHVK